MPKLPLYTTIITFAIIALSSCEQIPAPISPVQSVVESPTEVTNLTASIVDESKILLTWEDEASSEVGFEIFERSGSEGEFYPLMRTEANVTSVMLDKHRRAFDLYYKVRALNGNGATGFSNQAHVVGIRRAVNISDSGSWNEIAFSPDGSQIAATGQYIERYNENMFAIISGLVIADASTGETIHLLESPFQHRGSSSTCLSYSPDGSIIAVGTDHGVIESWDARTGKFLHSDNRPQFHNEFYGAAIHDLKFSPDGRFIAVVGNGLQSSSLAILRAHSPNLAHRKLDYDGLISDIEFSIDSHIIAVLLSGDGAVGMLYLYRAEDGHDEGSFEFEIRGTPSMAFHPDGELLALSKGHETILLDYRSLEIATVLPIIGYDVSFSIDGNHIVSVMHGYYNSPTEISICNTETGNNIIITPYGKNDERWYPTWLSDYKLNPVNSSIALLKKYGYDQGDMPLPTYIEIWY